MTQMQIGRLTHGPEHRWAVLALEDGGRQLRLSLRFAWPEANRLARELGLTPCACNPIYDFVQALLDSVQAGLLRVVLDDVEGVGIGAFLYVSQGGDERLLTCYPPDAVALALRMKVPIYATDAALRHAQPISPSLAPGEMADWLERVRPEDFGRSEERR